MTSLHELHEELTRIYHDEGRGGRCSRSPVGRQPTTRPGIVVFVVFSIGDECCDDNVVASAIADYARVVARLEESPPVDVPARRPLRLHSGDHAARVPAATSALGGIRRGGVGRPDLPHDSRPTACGSSRATCRRRRRRDRPDAHRPRARRAPQRLDGRAAALDPPRRGAGGEAPERRRPLPARRDRRLARQAAEADAAGAEELTTTRAEPRPREAYVPLSSTSTTTRPPDAAENEEDHDGRT